MKKRRGILLVLTVLGVAALVGCNLPRRDVAAIQTLAALTVQAAIAAVPSSTATSQAPATVSIPSANVPPPASATASCDRAQFVSETVPDDTTFTGGEDFTKSWTLKNTGTCSWTPSYSLVFVSGDALAGPSNMSLASNVNPGQSITVSVSLEAPDANGTYHGNWGLRNASGNVFAHFWVQIKVGSSSGGGKFAVTHVTYTFSLSDYGGHSDCPMMTAHITTNGAGDVTYHWTRSDGASASSETIHFNSATTKDVVTHWALGSVWAGQTHWLGIYIDEPNHQDMGHKAFTDACAP